MKIFKQKDGWTCPHSRKKKVRGTCQRCLLRDWYWCSTTGHIIQFILFIIIYPFWWLKYGRHMDKKGFMPDEKGYKKDTD